MANMNVPGGYIPGAAYEDAYYQRTERRDNKPGPKVPGNQGQKPPAGHREENATVTISKEAREQQNRTHFPNINDPNDHGFFTKIWDEDGNVVWDASWNNDVEPQKPEHGMPPHGEPSPGQLPHWTEISKDLAEHGFYKNMTRQEVDYLEGFLRSMRSAKDLNIFADKHTSGDLREFLKELVKGYTNADKGRMR